MKKINKYVLIGVTLVLVLIACTKEITEDFILNFKVDFPQETTIGFLNEPIETTFSIEGGLENATGFEMKYNAKKAGYFVVNDNRVEEGEFVPLSGTSPFTIQYVGTKTGANTVEITVKDPSNREESFEILYEIKNTAFDFEVTPSLNELYVSQVIDLEISIAETSVSEYDVFYVNASEDAIGAGEILVDNEILAPDTASKLSAGKATWQFRGTEVGEIELIFTAVNRFGIKADQTIKLRIGETPDFTFAATLNNNTTITVNNPAAINFDIKETGLPSSYVMTYASSNVGKLEYANEQYDPGEEFVVAKGISAGVYIGSIEGEHKLNFTVRNANDTPVIKEALVSINYSPSNGELPEIKLIGESLITISVGSTFEDPGATASDAEDGDITENIVRSGQVNTNVPGEYVLGYTVSDSSNNTVNVIRRVIVVENAPPVITLLGESSITLTVGDLFEDPGATATDAEDGDLTGSIVVGGNYPGNTNTAGTYQITYDVTDSNGIAAVQQVRTIVINDDTVEDTVAPVITLNGESTITVTVGAAFTDPGATATDNVDGDISANIVVGGSFENTDTAGTYTITYNVSDAAGNAATEVVRTIEVTDEPDTEKPVITLNGESTITVTVGATFTDPGATATDNVDGNLTDQIQVGGTFNNTDTAGTYTITYNVSDAAGNAADEAVRTIIVENEPDTEKPDITLNGESTVTVTVGATFTDPGATATDNIDGDISANIVVGGTFTNTDTAGTYTITYNVSDAAGNAADEVVRTVIVEELDTVAPVILLNGESFVVIQKGASFSDPGATATDNIDGDLTADIVVSGSINSNVPDQYVLVYSVTDSSNNTATVSRTVKVNDPPAIVVNTSATSGPAPLTVTFDNGQSSDSDGTISTSLWEFGEVGSNSGGFPQNVINVYETPGTYTAKFTVIDNDGGSAVRNITITVTTPVDTTPPVITLNGSATVTVGIGDNFTDPGATATDNIDGDLTGNIIIGGTFVNTSSIGSFTITYDVSDAAGNAATRKTRTINVIDDIRPVITVIGATSITVDRGSLYLDQGATASDNVDGNITSSIVTNNPVNTNIPGTYTVRYNVSDAAGNPATEKTRSVRVREVIIEECDNCPPGTIECFDGISCRCVNPLEADECLLK